jgi:quercetin dioxygenase-like cupin family protein
MPLLKNDEMRAVEINMDAAKNVLKQTAITGAQGWDGWSMRIFTLKKEGYTPFHSHEWPHINYIIKGSGTLFIDGKKQSVSPGDSAYIKGGEEHQFKNAGDSDFAFICIVPEEGDK